VAPEISWRTDRQTDVLIAILRHRSRGRSNKTTVDSRLRPRVQFAAIVYDDKVKQCRATWGIRWKFMTILDVQKGPRVIGPKHDVIYKTGST